MAKIHQLPEELANKIAAGEVIERPASVVKELMENALDAQATQLDVFFTHGGRQELSVSDNGEGMASVDVPLAFARHATSKIRTAEDLFRITTLGFRGEALPSIASVSRLKLTTRRQEDLAGTEIRIEGGKVLSIGPAGAPVGTRVEVRDLFFNTPARAKFLKTEATEAGKISDVVTGLALANPGVKCTLTCEGRVLLKTPGTGNLLECIQAVFGPELAENLCPAEAQALGLTITGYIGNPTVAKANRRYQFFFINGRLVASRLLASAVEKAMQPFLLTQRYPVFFLSLTIDPSMLDVNVHPTKNEVRFSHEQEVYRAVMQATRKAMTHQEPPPLIKAEPEERAPVFTPPLVQPKLDLARLVEKPPPSAPLESLRSNPPLVAEEAAVASAPEPLVQAPVEAEQAAEPTTTWLPELRVLGQLHATYIVAEGPDAFYLFDQHAVHERILYEELQQASSKKDKAHQPLLVPVSVDLIPQAAAMRARLLPELADLGFVVEEFGGKSLLVQAVPLGLRGDASELVSEAIEALVEEAGQHHTLLQRRAHALIRLACHAAVRAGEELPKEVQETLLARLSQCALPQTCPHGRPTVLKLTWLELEKRFARRK